MLQVQLHEFCSPERKSVDEVRLLQIAIFLLAKSVIKVGHGGISHTFNKFNHPRSGIANPPC